MAEDALLQMAQNIRKGMKSARERDSEGVLEWIIGNPRVLGVSRSRMSLLSEELRQHDDLSVSSLCEALGLPECLLFRKAKLPDAAKLAMSPLASPLYRKFVKAVAERRKESGKDCDPELCVIVVAGTRSMVITNLIPRTVPGLVHVYVPAEEGHEDIHIFPVADAAARLPRIFNKENDE